MACCKTCCKTFLKVLTIIITAVDVGLGWYIFYEIYHETIHIEENLQEANSVQRNECSDPQLYWKLYVAFEALGTILAVFEIYYLIKELIKDRRMFEECFSRAWFLVVAIYIFAIFPSSIVDIIYRDRCICYEGFSFSAWHSDVRDFFKGFLGGASVICLQVILHLADLCASFRRFGRFIQIYIFCVDNVPDKEEDGGCCTNTHKCFIISGVLAICYTALFITEIVFIFCVTY